MADNPLSFHPDIPHVANASETLFQRTGKLRFTMRNDYLFKMVLQADMNVLAHLTAALLHIPFSEIKEISVENPIIPGKTINAKTFILDVRILLNRQKSINLEMQVCDRKNWRERSLGYLCANFDVLNKGEDYANIRPAHHIGILDFDLTDAPPELYATYQMQNLKNHHVYSDKFTLSVLSLHQIELATEQDKAWGIDRWARFFSATTWEEIKMLAKQDNAIKTAAFFMESYAEDSPEMQQYLYDRQRAINREKALKRQEEERERAFQEQERAFQEQERALQERERAFQEQKETIQKLSVENMHLREEIEELKKRNKGLRK